MPTRKKSRLDLYRQLGRMRELSEQNPSTQNKQRFERASATISNRMERIMNTKSYKKYQDESYNALMDQEYGKSTALMEKAHNRKYSVAVGSVG